jgi:signal transduction histidine kinase
MTVGTCRGGADGPAILQLTTAPLLDNAGATTHVAQLGQDVTEQKRIQSGMLRAERLAAVGELAGKVAHEVNNPIAVISAKARLLIADEPLSSRAIEELGKIAELSDRVARIAQGLLSYCRPNAGLAQPVDLSIPLRKALAIVEAPAGFAGIGIEERLPEGLPHVRVNASEMEQIFLNLFLNALDAMPRGGRLLLEAAVADGGPGTPTLEVTIEDTGTGVPEHLLPRVFEPFVTTKEEGRGTGLGLSICMGLVRSNGGEIGLESSPGRGTRVRLRFPTHASTPEALVHA